MSRSPVDVGAGESPEPGYEATIRLNLAAPRPLIFVAGALTRSGTALLQAVLEYAQSKHDGPVAVDLQHVSWIDRQCLTPLLASDAIVRGAPAWVHRALTESTLPAPEQRREAR